MKAVVTGGCGFIGSYVVEELVQQGWDVLVVDRLQHGAASIMPVDSAVVVLPLDLADLSVENVRDFHQAYWFHLAALPFIPDSFHKPSEFFHANVIGTAAACKVALATRAIRFIHISTCEVYRSCDPGGALGENASLDPLSPYANSKLCAEVVTAYECRDILPYTILRLFNAYGPRSTYPYFIPEMIRQCLANSIIQVGRLDTVRDFTFVEDTARAIVTAAIGSSAKAQTINIASGVGRSMASVLTEIQRMTDTQGKPVETDSRRERPLGREPLCLIARTEKVKDLLSWQPEISFRTGLQKTIESVKSDLALVSRRLNSQ